MQVLSGAGLFTAPGAGDAVPVGPGSVLYVPASEPHHFTNVTSDLAVLVLFAPAEYPRAGAGR